MRQLLFHPVAQIGKKRDHIAFNRCERIHRYLEVPNRFLKGCDGRCGVIAFTRNGERGHDAAKKNMSKNNYERRANKPLGPQYSAA